MLICAKIVMINRLNDLKAVYLTSSRRNASNHYSKETVFVMYSSFIVPKGSILQSLLGKTVRNLHAFGIFLKNKVDAVDYITPRGLGQSKLKKYRTGEPLNNWQVAPAMLLMLMGIVLSAFAFKLELVFGAKVDTGKGSNGA